MNDTDDIGHSDDTLRWASDEQRGVFTFAEIDASHRRAWESMLRHAPSPQPASDNVSEEE